MTPVRGAAGGCGERRRLYDAAMAVRRPTIPRAVVGACALAALLPAPASARTTAAPPAADPSWWAPRARLLTTTAAPTRPPAARFASGLAGWALLGSGAVTVRAGGPGGHYAALRDNTTLETPPLTVALSDQVLLVTARAPVGSPLVRVTAVGADGAPHPLGELAPSASWGTYAFNASGLGGQEVRLLLDPVMGRADAIDLARVGEGEQVAPGMTLVRGAARRAAGPPAGALLTASGGPFELRTGLFTLATDAATVSVWMRGISGRRPSVALSAGSRSLGTAIAGPAWRAVRVPVGALRGHRVALTIASADATGLQLAYIGTVQRRPALHIKRFVAARPGSRPGSPIGVVVTGSRALIGVRVALEQRRGASWHRVGSGTLAGPGARVRLTVRLPRRAAVRAVFTGSEAVAAGVSPVRTRHA
jgi:hypothetical protein